MKHYVLRNDTSNSASAQVVAAERTRYVDVILCDEAAKSSAGIVVEFYQALTTLVEEDTYEVKLRFPNEGAAGGPLYWTGRTVIFWGDIQKNWLLAKQERHWASQVLNLSPRSILVGSAVMLLSQLKRSKGSVVSVHPNFAAASQESGMFESGTGTYLAGNERIHSASTRLSALRLLSEFVSLDYGEHMADTLRSYIGLAEPQSDRQSQLAAKLIRRSGADPLVVQAIEVMLDNIEEPLKISGLSQVLGISIRQLQRRFLDKTGQKLLCTYRELRLEHADSLLRNTDMTQLEIATAAGFSSLASMRQSFRNVLGASPELVRKKRFSGSMGFAAQVV